MKKWQAALLITVAAALVAVTIFTWGSVGSAATLFSLITMGSALLFQKFLTNRDEDMFDLE